MKLLLSIIQVSRPKNGAGLHLVPNGVLASLLAFGHVGGILQAAVIDLVLLKKNIIRGFN
jgi:hypothetical protein